MKRKDLKPGEWYRWGRSSVISSLFSYCVIGDNGDYCLLAGAGYRDNQYTDAAFAVGEWISAWNAHEETQVVLCDPPAWFSEVWVKREEYDEVADCLIAAGNLVANISAGSGCADEHLRSLSDRAEKIMMRLKKKGGSDE